MAAMLAGCGGKGYDEWDSQQMCELLTKDEAEKLVREATGGDGQVKSEPDPKNSLMYSPGCHFRPDPGSSVSVDVHRTHVPPDEGSAIEIAGTKAYQESSDNSCSVAIPLEEEQYYFWVIVQDFSAEDLCKSAVRVAEVAYPKFESG